MILEQGKVPSNILRELFKQLKISDNRVVVGPRIGFDSAVVNVGDNVFIVSNDPSGFLPESIPIEYFAFGAVHWPASDVAVFGGKPIWMIYTIIFPPGVTSEFVFETLSAIQGEAQKLNIAILGGHSGIYKVVNSPVVASTVIGETKGDKLVLPSNAKPGDYIILTKSLGLEISVALSYEKENEIEKIVGSRYKRKLQESYRQLSVVDEALILAEKSLVDAMHDVTEGGLSVALNEIADASRVGFEVIYEELPIDSHIKSILDYFGIDPLNTSNTGSLIAAIPPEKLDETISVLRNLNIEAHVIGKFTESGRYLIKNDLRKKFPHPTRDNYAKIF